MHIEITASIKVLIIFSSPVVEGKVMRSGLVVSTETGRWRRTSSVITLPAARWQVGVGPTYFHSLYELGSVIECGHNASAQKENGGTKREGTCSYLTLPLDALGMQMCTSYSCIAE